MEAISGYDCDTDKWWIGFSIARDEIAPLREGNVIFDRVTIQTHLGESAACVWLAGTECKFPTDLWQAVASLGDIIRDALLEASKHDTSVLEITLTDRESIFCMILREADVTELSAGGSIVSLTENDSQTPAYIVAALYDQIPDEQAQQEALISCKMRFVNDVDPKLN